MRQMEVLHALRRANRPVTAKELEQYMKAKKMHYEGCWKRLSELYREKAIQKVGTAQCTISGRKAIRWKADLSKWEKKV